ncbi:FtsX-like permease family protein [Sphingomonas sp.]|uniref:ABC transporter permease n=1 Tax=Sphingomonas sp. TaxID=28214 RepID=UPI00286E696D|nr:FtsX-like permease family protein [Sphingomonas sp.]
MSEALRLAIRDLRGGLGSLVLLWLCLALAVAGIAAVTSLASSIDSALSANGRRLLGGDLSLSVAQRVATANELQAINALGRVSKVTTLRATLAKGDASALVELSGVDRAWPLAGTVEFLPGGRRPAGAEAAVGAELAERLGIAVGDEVRVGYGRLRVSGIVRALPATSGFALAPPVLVDEAGLTATGLIQPGSLSTTSYRVVVTPGVDTIALAKDFQRRFPDGGWRAIDRSEAAGGTRRLIDRVGELLLLIALVSLAIGGLGISSAAGAFAASRRPTIATLKLLGARAATIRAMLGVEVGVIALVAIAAGLAVGALTPALVAGATAGWLPVTPDPSPQVGALGRAALFGLLVTIAAAWGPVAGAVATRPAEVFRDEAEPGEGQAWSRLIVPLLAGLAAAGFAIAAATNPGFTAILVGCLAGLAAVFAGLGLLIRRLARAGSHRSGPLMRLGIAALARPGAATVRLAVAMGLGLSLLALVGAVGSSLLGEIQTTIPKRAPALFLVDIPVAEKARFEALAQRTVPTAELRLVPTLRGPVTAVNGVPVAQMRDIPEGAWVLRGDRGLTFSAMLPEGNRIVAGRWWPADYRGPPLISLDVDAAEALNLKVGDKMTVAVLGRPIETRIASLRQIDWRSFGFNFAIIFAPGALERAPYTLMATVAPEAGQGTLALEQALARELPMVSTIRVADIITQVVETLRALEGAVRIATLLAIGMGVVVLAGSVVSTRRARQRDMVLLKLVGATRGEVLTVQLIEFAALSASVALVAVAAGALGAWAVVTYLLEFEFSPSLASLALPPLAAVLLSIGAALLAALPALLVRPATALRAT